MCDNIIRLFDNSSKYLFSTFFEYNNKKSGARGSVVLKVAGSIPNEVNQCFQFNLSFRPHKALESTQPLTEMSTRR
jgi:hypothetical protein